MLGQPRQQFRLGGGSVDWRQQPPGEPTVLDLEPIRLDHVEPEDRLETFGERREPTAHQRGHGTAPGHRPHQRSSPRHQPQSLAPSLIDGAHRQTRQPRHPGLERRHEAEIPGHRTAGDCADLGGHTMQRGQLVDALTIDQGPIHVAHQQPLGTVRERQDHQIDRPPCGQLVGAVEPDRCRHRDLTGLGLGQPTRLAAHHLRHLTDQRPIERGDLGIGDQAGDPNHPRLSIGGVAITDVALAGVAAETEADADLPGSVGLWLWMPPWPG